jgi:hypothetical protein
VDEEEGRCAGLLVVERAGRELAHLEGVAQADRGHLLLAVETIELGAGAVEERGRGHEDTLGIGLRGRLVVEAPSAAVHFHDLVLEEPG